MVDLMVDLKDLMVLMLVASSAALLVEMMEIKLVETTVV
jgi:hypothetical protein